MDCPSGPLGYLPDRGLHFRQTKGVKTLKPKGWRQVEVPPGGGHAELVSSSLTQPPRWKVSDLAGWWIGKAALSSPNQPLLSASGVFSAHPKLSWAMLPGGGRPMSSAAVAGRVTPPNSGGTGLAHRLTNRTKPQALAWPFPALETCRDSLIFFCQLPCLSLNGFQVQGAKKEDASLGFLEPPEKDAGNSF